MAQVCCPRTVAYARIQLSLTDQGSDRRDIAAHWQVNEGETRQGASGLGLGHHSVKRYDSIGSARRTNHEFRCLGYHLKTGHQLSLQNRPTEPYPGPDDVLPCRAPFRQVLLEVNASSRDGQGDRARGISAERFEIPLAGGAGAGIVTALFAGTRRVPAWGEPSPPRLAPGGNGKGG
jgi:hypothetical protein